MSRRAGQAAAAENSESSSVVANLTTPRNDGASGDDDQLATLIFNPNAGGGSGTDPEELQELLAGAGYRPSYRATESVKDLDGALREARGLIVVAGGDGTLREVAKRLWGRDRPVAVLPLGTANNIARSLGVDGPPARVVAGLERPRRVRVDVARVRGPWGDEFMLEGAGLGMFANILSAYRPQGGKSLLRAVGAAANNFGENPVRCRLELDGERLDGEYLLVEAMNMRAVGPRLALAPAADPSDGLLDIVLVRYENRDAWLAYLRGLMTNGLADLPSVDVVRGRKLRLHWRASPFHVDAEPYCEEASESNSKGYSAQIEVVPGALPMWLPAGAEGGSAE